LHDRVTGEASSRLFFVVALALSALAAGPAAAAALDEEPFRLEIECPARVNPAVSVTVTLRALDADGNVVESFGGEGVLYGVRAPDVPAGPVPVRFRGGEAVVRRVRVVAEELTARAGGTSASLRVRLYRLPGVLSLAPPLLAILLALLTRHVVLSLFCGVWVGATFLSGMNPLAGFLRSLDTYFRNSLADPDHASIVIFSLCLGGMVGIVARSGGLHAIAAVMARKARTTRSAQAATWLMGVAIFFDDYANTLLVGNTMRPFTDKLRISREKLAFIVDATAAPVASVAVISTWIGYEIGLIQDSLRSLGVAGSDNAYAVFLQTIPYRFYSIILLFTVLAVALTGRDFGAMLAAEKRSRREGKLLRDGALPMSDRELAEMEPPEGAALRWTNAAVPILVVVAVVVAGLYHSGIQALGDEARGAGPMRVLGAADSLSVLMWASAAGGAVAAIMALVRRILTVGQVVDAWFTGIKAMMVAMVVLVCAWSLGAVCGDLFTAGYVVDRVSGFITIGLLPTIVFLAAAAISFATGTSWGTMAILMPVVIPLGYNLSPSGGAATGPILASIAGVLSGSCFGDHASPISDTTILSSMASSCDHVDHVRTQLPYAVLAAALAIVAGFLPAGYGLHPAVSISLGLAGMVAFLLLAGRSAEEKPRHGAGGREGA